MSTDLAFDDADLNGFVDGRIDPARAAALAESLASDPEARARIDGWKRQNESLRTMFTSVLFEPIPIRLQPAALPARKASAFAGGLAVADAAIRTPGRLAGVVASTSIGMVLAGFALGALTSLGTDGFGLAPLSRHGSGAAETRPMPGDGPALAERAAEAHRAFLGDATHQVEMTSAEGPKLLRWLQHRLGPTLRIPDLTHQGWGLVGGRIVPSGSGPAAFLVYGNGGDRLGLTVTRMPGPVDGGIQTVGEVDPIGVSTWGEAGLAYALSTGRGSEWLERDGGALRDSVRSQAAAP